jgi:hypothetical protein
MLPQFSVPSWFSNQYLGMRTSYKMSSNCVFMCMDIHIYIYISNGAATPSGPGPPHCWGFTITLRHTTLGRTPLDEWSARRTELYVTKHSTHKRETFVPLRDSNPQSQHTNGRRSTPQKTRPLGSAYIYMYINRSSFVAKYRICCEFWPISFSLYALVKMVLLYCQ